MALATPTTSGSDYQRRSVPDSGTLRAVIRRYSLVAIAAVTLVTVAVPVMFADLLSPFDPMETVGGRLLPPLAPAAGGGRHWLGTDDIGRDLLSRLLYGGRVSLLIGLLGPAVGGTLGAMLGVVSAYLGGRVDMLVQRLTDALLGIPSILVAMTVTISLGFTVPVMIMAIALTLFAYASRLLRGHALVLRQLQYVEAARALGCSHWRVLYRYLMPNSWAPWIVFLSVNVGNAITTEAALSFLGIGIAPPTPSWGNLMIRAQGFFGDNPQLILAPGIVITVVVFCSNVVGDAIRDMLDPKLRGIA